MTYTKTIICLANSRKESGRCVAGLELDDNAIGPWLRPVSERVSEELSIEERRYQDGQDVRVLDVVEIALKKHRPHECQRENHVIDDEYHWVKKGTFDPKRLPPVAIRTGPLWINGYASFSGHNDRIPTELANTLVSSLILARPLDAKFHVIQGLRKRQVRLAFTLGADHYNLAVTDPKLETNFLMKSNGEYGVGEDVILCVSLGEPYGGYRYKLAASVIIAS